MSPTRPALSLLGAATLGALSALHLAWATGSPFPARDRAQLATVMAGTDELPSARACVVVAGGLAAAAGLVAGAGGGGGPARWARRCVALGFLGRGAAGITGRTHLLVPWTPVPEFVRLDRRYYGPLCLAIAATAALPDRRRRSVP